MIVYQCRPPSTWFILIVMVAVVGVLISNTLEIHTMNKSSNTFEGTLVSSQTYQFNNVDGEETLKLSSDGVNMYYDVVSESNRDLSSGSNRDLSYRTTYSLTISSIPHTSSMNQDVSSVSDVEFKTVKVPGITTKTGNLSISSATKMINVSGYDIPAVAWSSIKDLTSPLPVDFATIASFNATESQISFGQLVASAPQGVKYSFKHTSTANPIHPADQVWSADDDVLVIQSSSLQPAITLYGINYTRFIFSTPSKFKKGNIEFDINGFTLNVDLVSMRVESDRIDIGVPLHVGAVKATYLSVSSNMSYNYGTFSSLIYPGPGSFYIDIQWVRFGYNVTLSVPGMTFVSDGYSVLMKNVPSEISVSLAVFLGSTCGIRVITGATPQKLKCSIIGSQFNLNLENGFTNGVTYTTSPGIITYIAENI